MCNDDQSDIPAGPRSTGLALSYFHRHLYLSFSIWQFIPLPYSAFLDGTIGPLDRYDRSCKRELPRDRSHRSSRRDRRFEDEHHLPREAGSGIAGRQVAAIEGRRNVEEASIPARLLLNCLALVAIVWFRTSLSARGPIVILRACSFASLCIVAVTADRRLLKATWLVEPDELRCGYSRAAKRDRNWFVSHRTAFFFASFGFTSSR